jgi:hypothetical protein
MKCFTNLRELAVRTAALVSGFWLSVLAVQASILTVTIVDKAGVPVARPTALGVGCGEAQIDQSPQLDGVKMAAQTKENA